MGEKGHLPFHGARDDELVAEGALFLEQPDERFGQGIDAAFRIVAGENLARRLGYQSIGFRGAADRCEISAQRGGDHVDERPRLHVAEIVEVQQALAEPVAAAAARDDQAPGGGGHGAIVVADQALQDARFAAPAAGVGGVRNALLVGAAEQQPDERGPIQQPGRGQGLDDREIAFVVRGGGALGQRGADFVGDVGHEAMEHGGHQRPLLLGQALGGMKKEVETNRRETVARPAHGRAVPGRLRGVWPFFRHHFNCRLSGLI